jgi:hypothetical protein
LIDDSSRAVRKRSVVEEEKGDEKSKLKKRQWFTPKKALCGKTARTV